MYHAFAADGQPPSPYVVSDRRFAAQMRLLRLLRLRVISLDEHVSQLREGRLLPRSVVITIDDGYRDNLEIALPILRRFGYPATLFVVSGRLGQANDWDRDGELSGRPILDRQELRGLAAEGVTIGAHTRTHPSLPDVDPETARAEIAGSKADLESALDLPIELFAYPFGRHGPDAVAAARDAGFRAAFTTRSRPSRPGGDLYLGDRIEIRGDDSLLSFAAAVTGRGRGRP
jgi:peptidoglycan/xylan/chitin deacetylase (PgdA/CDA1 family)